MRIEGDGLNDPDVVMITAPTNGKDDQVEVYLTKSEWLLLERAFELYREQNDAGGRYATDLTRMFVVVRQFLPEEG